MTSPHELYRRTLLLIYRLLVVLRGQTLRRLPTPLLVLVHLGIPRLDPLETRRRALHLSPQSDLPRVLFL